MDDLVQALYSANEPHIPVLLKDQATQEQFEWFYDPFLRPYNPMEKTQDTRGGPIFAVEIPFLGDKMYFHYRPHPPIPVPLAAINDNNTLTIYVPAENHTLPEVQARFDAIIHNIEANLEAQRNTLRDWPMRFREAVINAASIRLNRLKQAASISAGLTFQLKPRPNAPDITVPLVRAKLRPAPINLHMPEEQQRAIAEESYNHILSIVENMGRVFEYSPKSFENIGEEAIRFHFLVQLNSQYEGLASGETFNFRGKTDIVIREGNTNLFIAECKIWSGASAFTDAIDQLQKYITWRDTKTAIILFNRNKGFSNVIAEAQRALAAHPQYKSGPTVVNPTRFRYTFTNISDPAKDYALTLLAFDIPAPDWQIEGFQTVMPS